MLPATIQADRPEHLQLPDVRRPERMPSLPAWVASRIALLKSESQPDRVTRQWRTVSALPAALILKAAEREAIERHIFELDGLCEAVPGNDATAEQAVLVAVTKMMMVLPSVTQNEHSAEARGEAYMAALDEVPPWAVQSAIRNWYRGDCGMNDKGQPYDYHWCPAPAELRRISQREMYRVKGRAQDLEKLLLAEPLLEFSNEHCRQMRGRLHELYCDFRNPPVGKDGSGGALGEVPREGAHCGTQPRHSPA